MFFRIVLKKVYNQVKSKKILFASFIILVVLLYLVYSIEKVNWNEMFKTIWDWIRWWIVTAATIWYWDKFPQSWIGQAIAILYIFISLWFFTQIITTLISILLNIFQRKMNWILKSDFKNHTIIYIENDESIVNTINELFLVENNKKLVLMTNDSKIPNFVESFTQKWYDIHWISWKPNNEEALKLANIQNAKEFILFKEENNKNSDIFMISYIIQIRTLNEKIKIIWEICDNKNKKLFTNAWCNVIINTELLSETLLIRSLTDDVHIVIEDLLSNSYWYEIYNIALDKKWIWKTISDINEFYANKNYNIISIKDINNTLHFEKNYKIENGDTCYSIMETKTNIL